jgi:hypothetical protein
MVIKRKIRPPVPEGGKLSAVETTQLPVVYMGPPVETTRLDSTKISSKLKSDDSDLAPVFKLLAVEWKFFKGADGNQYATRQLESGNLETLTVKGVAFQGIVLTSAMDCEVILNRRRVDWVVSFLEALITCYGSVHPVWLRVAPISVSVNSAIHHGVNIATYDEAGTVIQICDGKVEVVTEKDTTLFISDPSLVALSLPAKGEASWQDVILFKSFIGIDWTDFVILISWISYTIAHPKVTTTNFPIGLLSGPAGCGKSTICRFMKMLIDPAVIDVSSFPENVKSIGVAQEHAHLVSYDNLRYISRKLSDVLCQCVTGGGQIDKKLYSDKDQSFTSYHGPILINSIHPIIAEQDLAQRVVPLELTPINDSDRKSEAELRDQFLKDRPQILRGLYDLIAKIFEILPNVEVIYPTRMIEFSRWLAALESATNCPAGTVQHRYSELVEELINDAALSDPLMEVMLEFGESLSHNQKTWQGEPSELLAKLAEMSPKAIQYHRDFPKVSSALSKRLKVLKPDLSKEGIDVTTGRGKKRWIRVSLIVEVDAAAPTTSNDG